MLEQSPFCRLIELVQCCFDGEFVGHFLTKQFDLSVQPQHNGVKKGTLPDSAFGLQTVFGQGRQEFVQ